MIDSKAWNSADLSVDWTELATVAMMVGMLATKMVASLAEYMADKSEMLAAACWAANTVGCLGHQMVDLLASNSVDYLAC
jgi:hypothetical protein